MGNSSTRRSTDNFLGSCEKQQVENKSWIQTIDLFWQGTTSPPKEATSRILNPWEDSRLKEVAISRVAAATVKLIEVSSSIRYKLFGITAIGQREQAEFFR